MADDARDRDGRLFDTVRRRRRCIGYRSMIDGCRVKTDPDASALQQNGDGLRRRPHIAQQTEARWRELTPGPPFGLGTRPSVG